MSKCTQYLFMCIVIFSSKIVAKQIEMHFILFSFKCRKVVHHLAVKIHKHMKISKNYLSHENKLATTNNMNADAMI